MLSRCKKTIQDAINLVRTKIGNHREISGVLSPYRRLIIVTGMARSGTSVMAAFIGSHPDVRPVIGGGCWDVVESDLIRPDLGEPDWESINEVLKDQFPKMVLLKQPWILSALGFFHIIRPAKVVVCIRSRDEQIGGWNRSRDRSGEHCISNPHGVYNDNIGYLNSLIKSGATWVFQDQMDDEMGKRIGEYLGVDPKGFDYSILERRWRERCEKEWFDKYPIKKERRR